MRKLLINSRYLIAIPVIGCLLLTTGAVVMGTGRIVLSAIDIFKVGDFSPKASRDMGTSIIEIIGLFLVGTVAYITAIGLYRLFISDQEIMLPMRITINNLADLQNKITGILVAALAVAFLGLIASEDDKGIVLNYGIAISLVIAALTFFVKNNVRKKPQH